MQSIQCETKHKIQDFIVHPGNGPLQNEQNEMVSNAKIKLSLQKLEESFSDVISDMINTTDVVFKLK